MGSDPIDSRSLGWMQGDEGDFGCSTDAHGHGTTKADIDVEMLVAVGVETITLGIDPTRRSEVADAHLHGMGVTAQCQGDIGLGDDLATPMGGVVSEEDASHSLCALHGFAQVAPLNDGMRSHALVFGADDGKRVRTTMQDDVLVEQERPPEIFSFNTDDFLQSLLALTWRREAFVGCVVMIAQHRDDAMRGIELAERRDEWADIVGCQVLEVASEADDVGVQTIDFGD